MPKHEGPTGRKAQFTPTRGTKMADEIKRHANRLDDEQRSVLAKAAKFVIGGGVHAKAAAHRP